MSTGKQLKQAGQAAAIEHAGKSWKEAALSELRAFCVNGPGAMRQFAFEDFRAWATGRGLPEPPRPNAWGALPQFAVERGIMQPTGQYRPAKSKRTHGHPVRVYRSMVGGWARPTAQDDLLGAVA